RLAQFRRSFSPLPMTKNLHVLLLEDDLADAELIKFTLGQSGLPHLLERVEGREDYRQSLEKSRPDLSLSDYNVPGFGGLEALDLARALTPDTPFIFVTGTLGEERAIETLKRGASDYVLKNSLTQLVPAVHRALREAESRADRRRAEER